MQSVHWERRAVRHAEGEDSMDGRIATTRIVPAGVTKRGVVRDTRIALLLATLITVALHFMPHGDILLYPVRLFVTFIHESGHAVAGIVTGGAVESLHVSPDGSGLTLVRAPLWALGIVYSGGYLGAALFGALMLQVGRFSRWKEAGRAALYTAAIYLFVVTILWVHNPLTNLFTLITGLLLSAGIFAIARFSSHGAADFVASFLAVQCSLNALLDLRDLFTITQTTGGDNDALFMSQHYLLPPGFWAALWAIIAFVILAVSLWSYLKATSRRMRSGPAADSAAP
jgi:hypothetical protein